MSLTEGRHKDKRINRDLSSVSVNVSGSECHLVHAACVNRQLNLRDPRVSISCEGNNNEGAIQVLRNTDGGRVLSNVTEKKGYEGVRLNVISFTRVWVGGQFPGKKRYVTLEWPLREWRWN